MSYTQATVIIAAGDQAAAQEDFPGSFNSGFYEATEGADPTVATNYVCAGLWTDSDLSKVVNDVTWPRKVYFGDAQAILNALNLKPVEVPVAQELEPVDSEPVV